MSSSARVDRLCFFTVPEYRAWLPAVVRYLPLENAAFWDVCHCSVVHSSSAGSGLRFLLSRKNLFQPASAPAAPPCRWLRARRSFPLLLCTVSFPVSVWIIAAALSTFCLTPFHRGPRRGNELLLQSPLFSNIKGFFVVVFCNSSKVLAAVNLAADVSVRWRGFSPPQRGLGGRRWGDKVASAGSTPGHLALSKLLHRAEAPSAGRLGEQSIGSPTVFTKSAEAISQDE